MEDHCISSIKSAPASPEPDSAIGTISDFITGEEIPTEENDNEVQSKSSDVEIKTFKLNDHLMTTEKDSTTTRLESFNIAGNQLEVNKDISKFKFDTQCEGYDSFGYTYLQNSDKTENQNNFKVDLPQDNFYMKENLLNYQHSSYPHNVNEDNLKEMNINNLYVYAYSSDSDSHSDESFKVASPCQVSEFCFKSEEYLDPLKEDSDILKDGSQSSKTLKENTYPNNCKFPMKNEEFSKPLIEDCLYKASEANLKTGGSINQVSFHPMEEDAAQVEEFLSSNCSKTSLILERCKNENMKIKEVKGANPQNGSASVISNELPLDENLGAQASPLPQNNSSLLASTLEEMNSVVDSENEATDSGLEDEMVVSASMQFSLTPSSVPAVNNFHDDEKQDVPTIISSSPSVPVQVEHKEHQSHENINEKHLSHDSATSVPAVNNFHDDEKQDVPTIISSSPSVTVQVEHKEHQSHENIEKHLSHDSATSVPAVNNFHDDEKQDVPTIISSSPSVPVQVEHKEHQSHENINEKRLSHDSASPQSMEAASDYEDVTDNKKLSASTAKADVNSDLPATVTKLSTNEGSKVYLVGTAHFSKESQDDVSKTIRFVHPDVVMVELCESRAAILQLDEETTIRELESLDFNKVCVILRKHGKLQGILYLLLLSVSAHITKQLGMAPGGEFRTAFFEAQRSSPGCPIQLGDRPIQITLSRALASLSLWQKFKLLWHILASKETISKEDVEKCKQRDFIEELLAEMTGQFPVITEVFVKERDLYLTMSLQNAARSCPDPSLPTGFLPMVVVGVVGIGHVPGIVNNWGKVTPEDILPIMQTPPPNWSDRVCKFALRITFYGLVGFGLYKCLPNSTKSSVSLTIERGFDGVSKYFVK